MKYPLSPDVELNVEYAYMQKIQHFSFLVFRFPVCDLQWVKGKVIILFDQARFFR